jgi:hypothetical protein
VPGFLLGQEVGFFGVTGTARGVFALVFAVLALIFTPAGSVHNTVLPITLLCGRRAGPGPPVCPVTLSGRSASWLYCPARAGIAAAPRR